MTGGIYIVTLNNEELISTQAHDRRFDSKNPLKVNRTNRKFGKADDFNGRERQGYCRTFGERNVNFIPIASVKRIDLKQAEDAVKNALSHWRLRSPANRLTEWTSGISEKEMIQEILSVLKQLDIEHKPLK